MVLLFDTIIIAVDYGKCIAIIILPCACVHDINYYNYCACVTNS